MSGHVDATPPADDPSSDRGGLDREVPTLGGSQEGPRAAAPEAAGAEGVEPPAGPKRGRTLERGGTVGRHVVLQRIATGGMGVVYAAYDPELDRKVALKLLRPGRGGDKARARMLREAQALAKLAHPNVVGIHDVGTIGEQVWLAMELVEGQTLGAWLQTPRRWREVLGVLLGAGEGLAAAHAAGLLHRDFKPDNVMVADDGRARVMDFGLALAWAERPSHDDDRSQPLPLTDSLSLRLTQAGVIVGTPGYMAPEQLGRGELTAAADQFAFCVTLWEALHGERPFAGRTIPELVTSILGGQRRPPPKGRAAPSRLRRACERGLAFDPEQRWPSMEALLEELRRLQAPPQRWWPPVAVAGLAVVGLGIAQYAEVGMRCEGSRAHLEGIWDEARASEVREAILGTGVAYAADTWARVQERLDAYARAWADEHTEACEATSVRHELSPEVMDLRMACLRERRLELRKTVEVLARADTTRVENAVELVASLPGLARCDDVEALRSELPPPEDPEVAARVEALRERLEHARVLREAGEYDASISEAEAAVSEAEGLSYPPVQAEASYVRARARESVARYAEARADLERAYQLAAEHGLDRIELEAANRLVRVVGVRQEKHDAGLQWGMTALALARSQRFEPELEGRALQTIGIVLSLKGERDEALGHYQRALPILEEALGPDHHSVAGLLNDIGLVALDDGRNEDALAYFERASAILTEALGAGHPDVAGMLNNIGTIQGNQGRWTEALECFHRALAIKEGAYGADHPAVASSLHNIGVVLDQQGATAEALPYLERALAIREASLGPRHREVASSHDAVGNALANLGRLDESLRHHRQTLAIYEETLGLRHADSAAALASIGSVLQRKGELEEALGYYERSLAIRKEALGPDHLQVAHSLHGIGSVLRALGRRVEAKAGYERSLAIREATLGPHHLDVSSPLMGLAELALADGEHAKARGLGERALDIRSAGEASPAFLAEARFLLARALWSDRSQRGRARVLARQARDAYVELGAPRRDVLAEVEAWLREHADGG